jgi:hypothetical protein
MARIEWVEQKLKNWALYKSKEMGGGLGFSSQSAFLNDANTDRYRESTIPVDEVDASVTDQAVKSLEIPRPILFRTLELYYLEGKGINGTAKLQCTSPSTVHANLAAADRALRDWFDARPKPLVVAQTQLRVIGTLRRAK